MVTLYRLENGRYGRPEVVEMVGETASLTRPEVRIDWARVVERL